MSQPDKQEQVHIRDNNSNASAPAGACGNSLGAKCILDPTSTRRCNMQYPPYISGVMSSEAVRLAEILDTNLIQAHANELYGTRYKMGQTHIKTSLNSGQAHDNSQLGYIFCGSEYVAQLVAQDPHGFFVWFNRNADHGEMVPIVEFTKPGKHFSRNTEYKEKPMTSKCHGLKADGTPCHGGPQNAEAINHQHHNHPACGPTRKAIANGTFKGWQSDICERMEADRGYGKVVQEPLIEVPQDPAIVQAKLQEARDQLNPIHTLEEVVDAYSYTNVVVFGNRDVRNAKAVLTSLAEMWAKVLVKFANPRDICGAAKGGDFLGAKSAKIAGVPFKMVIPHKDYYETYKPVSESVWMAMTEAAQDWEFVITNVEKFHWSMNFRRNAVMAEMGDYFVCVSAIHPDTLRKATKGGTAHMLRECVYPKLGAGGKVYWVNSSTGEAQWVTFS